MLGLLFMTLCWCGPGQGLENVIPQAVPNYVAAARTLVNTHTVQSLFLSPSATQVIKNTLSIPTTVLNFIDQNDINYVVGDVGTLKPDIKVRPVQNLVLADTRPSPPGRGPRPVQDDDANISPYWVDPQGRPPSQAPATRTDDLAPSPPTCRPQESEVPPVDCKSPPKYRTIDGRCNNLLNPHLGTPGQPMPRILPPVYDEALMRTRSAAGGLLPNPRVVSLVVREGPLASFTNYNLLLMQLGQIIDHDMSVSALVKSPEGSPRKCGDCSSWKDPVCAPINIPDDDPHMQARNPSTGQRRCLPFFRSGAVGSRDSQGRPSLDQINTLTAFLDLSTVYGSDECRERDLRLYSGGLLIELKAGRGKGTGGVMPAVDAKHFEDCRTDYKKCFLAGDDRSNEHLGLLVMHQLLFREHNHLASLFAKLNPHWNDERLYQEARRLNVAKFQHIVYSEFLPLLLGKNKMAEYRLIPEKSGYYQGYDQRVNPGVLNEFANGVFRMGHTMIPDFLNLLDHNYLPVASVPLVQTFNNASLAVLPGMCDKVLRGLLGTRLRPVDMRLVTTILDHLFQGRQIPPQDLFSRNIARSRDHGIGPYIRYREACGGGLATSFDDLLKVMTQQAASVLRKAYAHVEDIDLFPGGLAETPVAGGMLGPTFSCIIAYQFLNTRRGDRFWYENIDAGFTLEQLNAVRSSSSLARLLCVNMDDLDALVPQNIFLIPSKRENPLVACDHLPSIDLNLWEELHYKQDIDCTYEGQLHPTGRFVNVSPCLTCQCQFDGLMHCKPQLSGCGHLQDDEHCRLLC
ncbi:salivary peroxidase/catechol oxidase [Procambarus clarkii]|uniref:salivary peroxidase/catechol oxidase n=1 Tax=Procambarus clarkii TaxID=6728 RepID=UPI0037445947